MSTPPAGQQGGLPSDLPTVDVRWTTTSTPADEALATHATALLGQGRVLVGRLCPGCGSSTHGRPWLRHDETQVNVSVSRSGPHLVTSIARTPLGIDVESVLAVSRQWDPTMVLAAGEVAPDEASRARLWVAKESVVKMLGTGLAMPMTEVLVDDYDVRPLPAPEGYAAAVCLGLRPTPAAGAS